MGSDLKIGDEVFCRSGSIDRNKHAGMFGRVVGFARLSSYHPREVGVSFDDRGLLGGWFWEGSVQRVSLPLTAHERFNGAFPDSFAA